MSAGEQYKASMNAQRDIAVRTHQLKKDQSIPHTESRDTVNFQLGPILLMIPIILLILFVVFR